MGVTTQQKVLDNSDGDAAAMTCDPYGWHVEDRKCMGRPCFPLWGKLYQWNCCCVCVVCMFSLVRFPRINPMRDSTTAQYSGVIQNRPYPNSMNINGNFESKQSIYSIHFKLWQQRRFSKTKLFLSLSQLKPAMKITDFWIRHAIGKIKLCFILLYNVIFIFKHNRIFGSSSWLANTHILWKHLGC